MRTPVLKNPAPNKACPEWLSGRTFYKILKLSVSFCNPKTNMSSVKSIRIGAPLTKVRAKCLSPLKGLKGTLGFPIVLPKGWFAYN